MLTIIHFFYKAFFDPILIFFYLSCQLIYSVAAAGINNNVSAYQTKLKKQIKLNF